MKTNSRTVPGFGWKKVVVDKHAMELIFSTDELYNHIADRAGLSPQELSDMTCRDRNIVVAKDIIDTLFRNYRQLCEDCTDLGFGEQDIEDMNEHLRLTGPHVDNSLLPGEVLIIPDA